MDCKEMLETMHKQTEKLQYEIFAVFGAVPSSLMPKIVEFGNTLTKESQYPLNSDLTPRYTWSFMVSNLTVNHPFNGMARRSITVRLFGDRGEIFFFPGENIFCLQAYRLTPSGLSQQAEKPEGMLAEMTQPDEVLQNFMQDWDGFIQTVLSRIVSYAYGLVASELGSDAAFIFSYALHLLRNQELINRHRMHLSEVVLSHTKREAYEIAQQLQQTKSIAKSKTLRAIRERCDKLCVYLQSPPPMKA